MSSNESPFSYSTIIKINDYEIEFKELREICQGGPLVGYIHINDVRVSNDLFGGPILSVGKLIFVPQFSRSFWGSKFEIAAINISDNRKFLLKGKYDLIQLDSIENNLIYFYSDPEKVNRKSVEIPSIIQA